MAETKKAVQESAVQSTEKAVCTESTYTVQELIDESDNLFKVPKECAVVALAHAKKDRMTVSEAKTVIEKFMKKEVK